MVSFCLVVAVGGLSNGVIVVELLVVINVLKLMSIDKQSGKLMLLANALSPIVSEKSIGALGLVKSIEALWLVKLIGARWPIKLMSKFSPTSTAATQG